MTEQEVVERERKAFEAGALWGDLYGHVKRDVKAEAARRYPTLDVQQGPSDALTCGECSLRLETTCPCCDSPAIRETRGLLLQRKELVNEDVRRAFNVSPSNASNRLDKLWRLGIAERVRTECAEGGGLQYVYAQRHAARSA